MYSVSTSRPGYFSLPYTINSEIPQNANSGPLYANTAFNYLNQMVAAVSSITPQYITPALPVVSAPPGYTEVTPPSFQTISWSLPSVPNVFNDTLNVDNLLPAPFDDVPPELVFVGSPSAFTDLPPDPIGVDLAITYPTLNLQLPAPPNLLSLNIAPFAGLNFPTFSASEPVLIAAEPTVQQYVPGSMYNSALLTSLSTTLRDRILNGGTGLPPHIEAAIWDRSREREYRQVAAAIADLERMEALGYAFAPGVYADARIKIQTEANYNIANSSREVMIKQAELELTNVLKALDTATQLESQFMNYMNEVEKRALEAAKYVTQANIEVYNAKVKAFAEYVEAYKAKVNIYESLIKAETAKVEAYKAQVDAEKAKADVNSALVDQYKVASDVALSAVQVYKAEIDGIQARADIEKTKVLIYGEQIKGYVARINAYTAQIEAYKASVQTEGVKQDTFKSKVEAYSVQVEAAAKVIQAKIEEYKGKIEAKQSEYEGYKAIVTAESEKARAISTNNSSLAAAFQAQATSRATYNEILLKNWTSSVELAQKNVALSVDAAKANGDMYLNAKQVLVEGLKMSGTVSAQITAAAFNQYNASDSNSFQRSVSSSFNYQSTRSESYSAQDSQSAINQATAVDSCCE